MFIYFFIIIIIFVFIQFYFIQSSKKQLEKRINEIEKYYALLLKAHNTSIGNQKINDNDIFDRLRSLEVNRRLNKFND